METRSIQYFDSFQNIIWMEWKKTRKQSEKIPHRQKKEKKNTLLSNWCHVKSSVCQARSALLTTNQQRRMLVDYTKPDRKTSDAIQPSPNYVCCPRGVVSLAKCQNYKTNVKNLEENKINKNNPHHLHTTQYSIEKWRQKSLNSSQPVNLLEKYMFLCLFPEFEVKLYEKYMC